MKLAGAAVRFRLGTGVNSDGYPQEFDSPATSLEFLVDRSAVDAIVIA